MTKYNVSDTPTHARTRPRDGNNTGRASDAQHARQGARAEWLNEALEAARSSHRHSSRAVAASCRASERSRPHTQARWLRRGPLVVEASTPHRSPRASLLEARRQPATPASSRAPPRLVGGRSSACRQHLQRCRQREAHGDRRAGSREHSTLVVNENRRVPCSAFLLSECYAVQYLRPFCEPSWYCTVYALGNLCTIYVK